MDKKLRDTIKVAEQFAESCRLTNMRHRQTGRPQDMVIAQGALLAFSIELFMKALLLQDGKSAYGHDLWKLYTKLSAADQAAIQQMFDDPHPGELQMRKNLKESYGVETTLVQSIKEGRDCFEILRYIHEGKREPQGMQLGDVMTAVRRVLFQRFSKEPDIWLAGEFG